MPRDDRVLKADILVRVLVLFCTEEGDEFAWVQESQLAIRTLTLIDHSR